MAVTITPINHGTVEGDGTGESGFSAFEQVNTNEAALKAGVEQALLIVGRLTPVFVSGNYTASTGDLLYCDSAVAAITITLPAGVDLDNIMVIDAGHNALINNITIMPNGVETIDDDTEVVIDHNEGWCGVAYDSGNTNWQVALSSNPRPGYSNINAQTDTTYEFVDQDFVDAITASNASASTYDIPDSLGMLGDVLNLLNIGAGEVTITVAGTDTLGSSNNKCATGKAISILKTAATTWWVIGGSA